MRNVFGVPPELRGSVQAVHDNRPDAQPPQINVPLIVTILEPELKKWMQQQANTPANR